MTQNNEREVIELNDIALKQQSEAWLAVFHILNEVKPNWLDSNLPARDCAVNAIKELSKSQNEQQEPFGYFKAEPFGWTDCAETDEGAIPLYESPPKQAIPEGWKLTEKEILEYASEEELFLFVDELDLLNIAYGILELVQIKLNAAPTNTEVGE